MDGDTWSLIGAVAGIVTGLAGLVIAIKANRRADAANQLSREANELANSANRLSLEANRISERALESSERIGRDQINLHRREVDLVHLAEQSKNRANIQVRPAMKTSSGIFNLKVENRGPHHADGVTVSLHRDGNSLNLGKITSLAPGKATEVTGNRGSFLAGAIETEVDDLSRAGGELIELQVTFTDGNGPQILRKLLTITPGSRFVDRRWTIEDQPTGL